MAAAGLYDDGAVTLDKSESSIVRDWPIRGMISAIPLPGIKTSIWYRVWSWYRPICICWSLMASTHWSSSSNILVSSFTLYICSGFIFESHMTMIKSNLFGVSALKSNQLVEKSRMSVNFCSACFQFNYIRLMYMHSKLSLLMLIIPLKFLLALMTKCLCREQVGQASTMWRLFILIPRRHPDNEPNEAVTDAADEKAIDTVIWNDPCAGRIKKFQAN